MALSFGEKANGCLQWDTIVKSNSPGWTGIQLTLSMNQISHPGDDITSQETCVYAQKEDTCNATRATGEKVKKNVMDSMVENG
jgi:hypothetical protein